MVASVTDAMCHAHEWPVAVHISFPSKLLVRSTGHRRIRYTRHNFQALPVFFKMLSDSDAEDGTQLTINEHYAKAYAHRKEREELQKCAIHILRVRIAHLPSASIVKDKYGSDAELDAEEEEDSEELESEDEDGDELTPAMDAAILRTLARIKRRDPTIYDADKGVFEGVFSQSDSRFA
jgi:hypothetical protein